MIVRLKVTVRRVEWSYILLFQFYDSPIKSGEAWSVCGHDILCFNSMIVRLKDRLRYTTLYSLYVFQFYDSPIKRRCSAPTSMDLLVSIL